MTAKEYLGQAKYLNTRINSKIKQINTLNHLATNATSVLSGMPRNPNKATSKMADVVDKIVDLQAEINHDVDELVDLEREITQLIKSVTDLEYQTILEKRYLCFQTWEAIAAEMQYDIRWLYRLHGRALEEVQKILDKAA